MVLLLRGNWAAGFRTHAFAPMFLAAVAGLTVLAALPGSWRRPAVAQVLHWERTTPVTTWILGALVFYWLLRLFLWP